MADGEWEKELEIECSKPVPSVEKVRDLCRDHGVSPAHRARAWQVLSLCSAGTVALTLAQIIPRNNPQMMPSFSDHVLCIAQSRQAC